MYFVRSTVVSGRFNRDLVLYISRDQYACFLCIQNATHAMSDWMVLALGVSAPCVWVNRTKFNEDKTNSNKSSSVYDFCFDIFNIIIIPSMKTVNKMKRKIYQQKPKT